MPTDPQFPHIIDTDKFSQTIDANQISQQSTNPIPLFQCSIDQPSPSNANQHLNPTIEVNVPNSHDNLQRHHYMAITIPLIPIHTPHNISSTPKYNFNF